ncbi:large ribosomal subunit protein eL28y-like [Aristolochia californica]|uniref:large ribosomal subunit protein eL28y-like n=1 Tax=Aristolochia californica TaxID=171875 RepID=UPI0035E35075
MASAPGDIIWEIMKKNNSFLVKEFGSGNQMVLFNKEKKNFFNLNSYKNPGLSNMKTIFIRLDGKDLFVVLETTKTKKHNRPVKLFHKVVMMKEFRLMTKLVIDQVVDIYYISDLKLAALARVSAMYHSLKVAKSGLKKRNRQTVRK